MTFDRIDGFDPHSLELLQRMLLTSDGTLTDALEAAFQEKIDLVRLENHITQAKVAVPILDLEPGAAVMQRKILLRGQRTQVNYVYAESLLAIDRLDPAFRDQLINSDIPIGRLWQEHRLETWKEGLTVFRRPAGEQGVHFGIEPQSELFARTFRVFTNHRPFNLITEYFPQLRAE